MAATGKKQRFEDKGLGTKRHVRRRKPRAFWEVLLTLDTTGNPSSRFENEDELTGRTFTDKNFRQKNCAVVAKVKGNEKNFPRLLN